MKDRKDNRQKGNLPTQMNLGIRIVAGGYLLYLAYSIYGNTKEVEGAGKIVFPLAMVLFVLIGVVIIFSSLRAMQRGEYVGGSADTDQGTEAGDGKGKEQTTPDRIRFGEPKTTAEGEQTTPDRIRFGEPKTTAEGEQTTPDRIRFGEPKTLLKEREKVTDGEEKE